MMFSTAHHDVPLSRSTPLFQYVHLFGRPKTCCDASDRSSLHKWRTTCSCALYHQRPTRCIQREAVAIRTKLRHRDPSLTSNWSDDAEQRVRASKHNVLHNAQLFCLILRYLPKCFSYSVESSFRGLYFNPEMKMPLCASQSPLFKASKHFFIIFRATDDVTAFYMF